jgi:ammonium transporter, Amt family
VPPCQLKIELTESVFLEDSEGVIAKLNRLKAYGIQLVIDDFGTGYSSLSYIRRYPIDNLKIDRSFIQLMNVDDESMEIVKTIVTLAKNLGLTVVAEGVEQESQLNKLKSLFCDTAQGFLFSKPVASDIALQLIKGVL